MPPRTIHAYLSRKAQSMDHSCLVTHDGANRDWRLTFADSGERREVGLGETFTEANSALRSQLTAFKARKVHD
jgi:hypothetical protein